MKYITKLLVISSFALQITCAHKPKSYQESLKAGKCETSLEQLAAENKDIHLVGQVKQVAGTTVSYTATGLAYVGDVVLTVVGGAVIFAALCGPMLAVSVTAAAAGSHNGSPLTCLPGDLSKISVPKMGSSTYKATKEWRCPDLSHVSHGMRQVSGCFADRKDLTNLQKAKSNLESLYNSASFRECISAEELKLLEGQLLDVNRQITGLAAG